VGKKRKPSTLDIVIDALLKLSRRKYECTELSECLEKFAEDLNRVLVKKTNYYCFVELYTSKMISVACGLDMIYIDIDYEHRVVETVKFKPLKLKVRGL